MDIGETRPLTLELLEKVFDECSKADNEPQMLYCFYCGWLSMDLDQKEHHSKECGYWKFLEQIEAEKASEEV